MAANGARGKTTRREEATPDASLLELSEAGLSLAEIADQTGLAKTTVHERLQRLRVSSEEAQEVADLTFQRDRGPGAFVKMLEGLPMIGQHRLAKAKWILRINPAAATSPVETWRMLTGSLGLGRDDAELVMGGWHADALARDPGLGGRLFAAAPTSGWAAYAPAPAPPTPSDPLDQLVKMLGLMKGLRDFDGGGSSQLSQQLALRPQGLAPEVQAMITESKVLAATLSAQMDAMRQQSERDQEWMRRLTAHQQIEAKMQQEIATAKAGMSAADRVSVDVTTAAIRAGEKLQAKSDERMERFERLALPILRNFASPGGAGLGVPVPTSENELANIAAQPSDAPDVTEPEEALFPGPPVRRDGGV